MQGRKSGDERGQMLTADYLGSPISKLLATPPFSGWNVARSIEENLPEKEIWYEFEGHGVEVICDGAERIRTIFLHRGDGEALADVAFSLSRRQVCEHYGSPTKSGAAGRIPSLGEYGPWDRFTVPSGVIHVQYRLESDDIDMITLMRSDAVP
jgi:hypothetical protein